MHPKGSSAAESLARLEQEDAYSMQHSDFGRGLASWQYHPQTGQQTIGASRPIHFAPANGMPAATYLFFIEQLAKHGPVYTLDNRGAWPGVAEPARQDNWWLHLEDFLAFAKSQYSEPIHYVGHSMGASVGMLAALRHPQMFASITMLDPGTVPSWQSALFMRLAPERIKQSMPLIKTTRARRKSWPTRQAFISYIRERRTYRNFSARALHDYAHGGLAECEDGVCLRFMPAWEAHNFKATVYVWGRMHKLKVPAVLVRGEHSGVFPPQRYREINARLTRTARRGRQPALQLKQLEGLGHMLPQEGLDPVLDVVLANWARV
ncbi:MAG: alpha/beta hydrolase [Gammaproteobacteria bacterium]|nr:alpha/beta hydrolase [Gammaproteobacteria bacterium]MBT8152102.1 alpha/beta hydrolase [Gammaproteobacteria bacterium]NND39539.1 alpha/beta hydrolase [Pseudomonadales bacterium]NNM11846.1 alpha/beta hydrolase [Pseudomonadales bacterium]